MNNQKTENAEAQKKVYRTATSFDAHTLGFAAAAALLGVGFAMAVSVSAYADPEMRVAEKTAIENRDYDAWLSLHSDVPNARTISEADFDVLVQMHEARESGDYEKASALRESLDLPFGGMGFGRGMGPGGHMRGGMMDAETHDAVEAALEAGDYDAWKALMGDRGPAQVVTEENFSTFVDLHNAMEAGDTAKAEELRAELGLGAGAGLGRRSDDRQNGGFAEGMHSGPGRGMHR